MTAVELVEIFFEQIWNQNRLDQADALFPPDFVAAPVAHQPMWPGSGPESMKHHIQEWRSGIPDLQMQPIAVIAQGDQVAVQWQMVGTHAGVLYGVSATGRAVKAQGITIFVMAHSQIRELRTAFDALGLLQQLDVLPEAGTLIQHFLESQRTVEA